MESIFLLTDEVHGLGHLGRLLDLLIAGFFVPVPQVGGDGTAEQYSFLRHIPDLIPQLLLGDILDIHAVHQDLSPCYVIEPGDKIDEGGFARSRGSDKRGGLAGFGGEGDVVKIDLNRPMAEILKELTKYPVSTRLSLNGTIIVGRDIAHAKLKERLDRGEDLPQYIKDHPIYYAGPAKTPAGMACGSMGPTTAGRMDSYVELFQSHGGSMVMLAKGNRSQQVTDACQKYGGFYLGSIGGPAAILAQNNIKSIECVEYPELGMEAIWKIEVEDFPAFILVDDKGNDFFKQIKPRCAK